MRARRHRGRSPRARAGSDRPTSLHQVFALLQLPPDRWARKFDLVAANDRGHIAGMLQLSPPATQDEIVAIRAADRAGQGITPDQEKEAEEAVRSARVETEGMITIIELPHDRTSAAADRMEPLLGGPGYQNLLIITPSTFAFYGWGAVVMQLATQFPEGWYWRAPCPREASGDAGGNQRPAMFSMTSDPRFGEQ